MADTSISKSDQKRDVVSQWRAGKATAEERERRKALLRKRPEFARKVGDLAELAAKREMDSIAGHDACLRDCIEARSDSIRDQLDYDKASGVEKLLIDQVVLCSLRLGRAEYQHTGKMNGTLPVWEAEHFDRLLTSAQRRYLRAIQALAAVRKLVRSSMVQINVGEQQVNVAGRA